MSLSILTNLFAKRLATAPEPWVTGSIYEFVAAHISPVSGRFDSRGLQLPDDAAEDGTLRWVDGALDGVLGHHGASEESVATGKQLASLIDRVARTGDQRAAAAAYATLKEASVLGLIDRILELLGERRSPFQPYLSRFALQLATQSADRAPVKVGIALLGAMRLHEHEQIVTVLGKHEEFTLYSAAALANMFEDASERLLALARTVEGWGRIHIVERLVPTRNPRIQQWLRREGFRNSVMYGYLALTAAVHGRLRDVLEQPVVLAVDLAAAGEILGAMIAADGGPALGMNAYADAVPACQLYLAHISKVPPDLLHLESAQQILRYVQADLREEAERLAHGWSEAARVQVTELARHYITRNEWHAVIRAQLASEDARIFDRASRAAQQAGIDAYEWYWRRVCADPQDATAWLLAMDGANSERIDQLVALAERALPLDRIAAGPAAAVALGAQLDVHSCLELVLQRLKDFPGKGMNLIAAGLRSPVIRDRNMAVNALAAADPQSLPAGTKAMIDRALGEETVDEIRTRLIALHDRF